jgi:hypothetical protein
MWDPISVTRSTTHLRPRHFVIGAAVGVVSAVALAVASGDAVTPGPADCATARRRSYGCRSVAADVGS